MKTQKMEFSIPSNKHLNSAY